MMPVAYSSITDQNSNPHLVTPKNRGSQLLLSDEIQRSKVYTKITKTMGNLSKNPLVKLYKIGDSALYFWGNALKPLKIPDFLTKIL